MTSLARAAAAVAAILVREGLDYAQSKAVFKAARQRAGLQAPPARRGGVDRLTVEEELRFLDQAYARDGRTGLMLQTLLETGLRASELVQLRIEDISLAERVVIVRQGKSLPSRRRGAASGARCRSAASWPSCSGCTSAPAGPGRCSPAASKARARCRIP